MKLAWQSRCRTGGPNARHRTTAPTNVPASKIERDWRAASVGGLFAVWGCPKSLFDWPCIRGPSPGASLGLHVLYANCNGRDVMNKWLVLSIAASIGVIAAHSAQAAPMSCTDYKSICLSKGSKKCDGAWKQCMRTGIYIGPDSGTNHGQADKR